MTEAGADVLVPHMGLTTKGTIGAQTAKTLDECVIEIQAMRDAAVAVNPDVIVLCHGGPLAEPEDAQYVLDRTEGIVGFFGASSMERLPTEVAMTENMRRFKALAMPRGDPMPSKLIDPAALPTMTLRLGRHQAARRRPTTPTARRQPDARRAAPRARATSATTTRTPTRSSTSSPARASRWSTTTTRSRSARARRSSSRRPRSTRRVNTGWEPLVLLAIYAPAGAEEALKALPDYLEVAPGEAPALVRG